MYVPLPTWPSLHCCVTPKDQAGNATYFPPRAPFPESWLVSFRLDFFLGIFPAACPLPHNTAAVCVSPPFQPERCSVVSCPTPYEVSRREVGGEEQRGQKSRCGDHQGVLQGYLRGRKVRPSCRPFSPLHEMHTVYCRVACPISLSLSPASALGRFS